MSNTIAPIPTLVKSSLYDHADPLLRRLRLEDPYGRPIDNLKDVFLGKEILIFYVGSMHGNGTQTIRDLSARQVGRTLILGLYLLHL